MPLWAGDGDNDLGMINLDWRGIIVGNASTNLRDQVCKRNRTAARMYVYHSQEQFALGVLDGLKYWKEQGSLHSGTFDAFLQ